MNETTGLLLRPAADPARAPHSARLTKRISRLVRFSVVGSIVRCFDVALIVATSMLTGIAFFLIQWGDCGPLDAFFGIGTLTAVNFSAILSACAGYRPQKLANFRRQMIDVSAVWIVTFFVLSVVAFSLKVSDSYSRGATLSFFVIGWSVLASWRLILSRSIARAVTNGEFAEQRVILLAEEGQLTGSSLVQELNQYGYKPARTYQFSPDAFSCAHTTNKLVQLINEILDSSRKEAIDSVFLLVAWNNRHTIDQLMNLLKILTVPVHLLPDRNVAHFLAHRTINIGPSWIAELKRAPLTTTEQVCKRLLDISMASFGLIVIAPLMALVALLIKIESAGPVLFMQTRNGFNGRPFRICKFRTMYVVEDGPVIRQATKNDPRITRLGRMLRRTNIDELPQLLNVIAGDMSLVGPRPHAAAHNTEYEKLIANYAFRYHVKPGLTGWAQVNGFRGETRTLDLMAKRVEFDLSYIDNWSFWLDCKILLRTLLMGLQPNAY
jgi:Undecaprenyl-phosphate glucose phosphotransferase